MLFSSFVNSLMNLEIISIKFSIVSEILKLNKYLASLKEYYFRMAEDSALFDEVAPLN